MHQPTLANVKKKNKFIILEKLVIKWSTQEEVPCPQEHVASSAAGGRPSSQEYSSLQLEGAGKEALGLSITSTTGAPGWF